MVTAWLPLVNLTQQDGTLTFASGSHLDVSLAFWNDATSHKSEEAQKNAAPYQVYKGSHVENRYPMVNYGDVGPGDVLCVHFTVNARVVATSRS